MLQALRKTLQHHQRPLGVVVKKSTSPGLETIIMGGLFPLCLFPWILLCPQLWILPFMTHWLSTTDVGNKETLFAHPVFFAVVPRMVMLLVESSLFPPFIPMEFTFFRQSGTAVYTLSVAMVIFQTTDLVYLSAYKEVYPLFESSTLSLIQVGTKEKFREIGVNLLHQLLVFVHTLDVVVRNIRCSLESRLFLPMVLNLHPYTGVL